MHTKVAFHIHGKPVTQQMIQRVKTAVGDKVDVRRIFFRADYHNPRNLWAWLRTGIKQGWVYNSCAAEYEKGAFQAWVQHTWESGIPKDMKINAAQALRAMADRIEGK